MADNNTDLITDAYTDNARAFDELLNQIEAASDSLRDKGARFETLTRLFFERAKGEYEGRFSKIQTFANFARSTPSFPLNSQDIGIDLVATRASDGRYVAIQCKFYRKDHTISAADVDSFIAASYIGDFFAERILVTTNNAEKWSYHALDKLRGAGVQLITRRDLATSDIDWSAYLKNPAEVKKIKPLKPRPYQQDAIRAVVNGFKNADRGKLIMACGTGKTFTSLKIAEEMIKNLHDKERLVMFLVPSLSLLSQTLNDWKKNCQFEINAFAVCSDSTTGKMNVEEEDNLLKVSQLRYPATTNAKGLTDAFNNVKNKDGMTVIFSTYQSIEVVSEAQKVYGFPDITLTICDEAHRTAGGYLIGDEDNAEDTAFTRIHDNNFIRSKKRLYMTATPKIYGSEVKKAYANDEAVLYSMDDSDVFGETFHSISFRRAVELGSLVDYKVIVLTVDESVVSSMDAYQAVDQGGLNVSDAAKVIGCWRALSKQDLVHDIVDGDTQAMKRAVGFAQVINPSTNNTKISSKLYAKNFQSTVDDFKAKRHAELVDTGLVSEEDFQNEYGLVCETKHIDGNMDSFEKEGLLQWLRDDVENEHCKILFNVRCLSEGVDVPALDSVIFLSPRKSQVDVVQTVGRVMRTSKQTNKKRGYVIIPIVTPAGVSADLVLNNNKDFDTVWQILKALRSIDPAFGTAVDGQLKKIDTDKIEVVCLTEEVSKRPSSSKSKKDRPRDKMSGRKSGSKSSAVQGTFDFGRDTIMEENIKTRIVQKVGNTREWSDWAKDVGDVCQIQIEHLTKVIEDPTKTKQRKAFDAFLSDLKATLNESMSQGDAVEMLAQHIVTAPIMNALFSNEQYKFIDENPIGKALTSMVNELDKTEMEKSKKRLAEFYDSVRYRASKVTDTASRMIVVRELFDKFFKYAFPKQQDKLGIVYTPEEIVDFINQSVSDLLKKEFGQSLGDDGVHILDPFTGTGTFITRLMQSGLIPKEKLKRKFEYELHANEIVPLAYYIASMNVETVYHDLTNDPEYKPNRVMVLSDTFVDHSKKDLFNTALAENNSRLADLSKQDIRVIIGNPPYSVGQESQNDDNQNEHYEELDRRIAETYVARTDATLKGKLYDSYIRGIRWASDRIGNKGIIGFVTNAGWIESNSANGMRKCIAEEFNAVYVYHLKGDQFHSVGEKSKQEGGKIFAEGSRMPVAILFFVKNPDDPVKGKIYFHAIDDYLSREEKLAQVKASVSVLNLPVHIIKPDRHGDWFNQREDSFSSFIPIGEKKGATLPIFANFSLGVVTSRDAWAYNSSIQQLELNLGACINNYNKQVKKRLTDPASIPNLDPKLLHWDEAQKKGFQAGRLSAPYSNKNNRGSLYRPFLKQRLYFERFWNNRVYQMPKLFPDQKAKNLVICVTGVGSQRFNCLMVDRIPCLDFLEKTQSFPRYLYDEVTKSTKQNDLFSSQNNDGRKDGITPEALKHFSKAYAGHSISVDDLFYYIYGILHSEDYRSRYANNLIKELPRIPRVATYEQFIAFSEAGRKLADLHVNYEQQPEYADVTIDEAPGASYRVTQMRYGKIKGKTRNAAKDKTMIIYNEDITISNIPLEAQEYMVNKKSALDWIVERARVSVDTKTGIVNDFNDYGMELTPPNPRYPLSLVLKVITVSIETMKIVKSLPPLEIHPLDLA